MYVAHNFRTTASYYLYIFCVCYWVPCVFVFVDEVYRDKIMPPVRYQNIGRRTRKEIRFYNLKNNETEEERRQRMEANRMRISQARSTRSSEIPIPST